MSPETSMHTYMETWVHVYGTVFVSQSPHFCSHTLQRICTCISICTYVILNSAPPTMHINMETWVPMCGTVWCSSQSTSSPTLCLRCVYASVHFYMSTWLPMLAQPPMDSYMETWMPLCVTVCVSQSPCFWSHTLVRMCTHISTWIYAHLTPHVSSTHYA